MVHRLGRVALLVLLPLLLTSCLLTPGKFTSKLVINADRSFTFSYQGEVIALDPTEGLGKGALDDKSSDEAEPTGDGSDADTAKPTAWAAQDQEREQVLAPPPPPPGSPPSADKAAQEARKQEEKDRKLRAVADALRKERGYRSVEYVGKGKFVVDYQISGSLTHNFIYPFNIDAEAIFPFIALELRGPDLVRVKAPAFGSESAGKDAIPGAGDTGSRKAIDGTFTLETNAEIVSQNNEDGAKTTAGRKTISWRITPITKDAPTAVLRMGPVK